MTLGATRHDSLTRAISIVCGHGAEPGVDKAEADEGAASSGSDHQDAAIARG